MTVGRAGPLDLADMALAGIASAGLLDNSPLTWSRFNVVSPA